MALQPLKGQFCASSVDGAQRDVSGQWRTLRNARHTSHGLVSSRLLQLAHSHTSPEKAFCKSTHHPYAKRRQLSTPPPSKFALELRCSKWPTYAPPPGIGADFSPKATFGRYLSPGLSSSQMAANYCSRQSPGLGGCMSFARCSGWRESPLLPKSLIYLKGASTRFSGSNKMAATDSQHSPGLGGCKDLQGTADGGNPAPPQVPLVSGSTMSSRRWQKMSSMSSI